MTTVEDIQKVQEQLDFHTNLQKTGSGDWQRLFIVDKRGYSIGRINFFKGDLYNIKNYKRNSFRNVDETDVVFMRLDRFLKDGRLISCKQFHDIKVQAFINANELMDTKIAVRAMLPKYNANGKRIKRKKLKFPNVRNILYNLLMGIATDSSPKGR